MSGTRWDPAQYERYKSYRDRPALDLMVQIPADIDPAEVWDLGCGTGEHAALLKRRHPGANVHGLDSSPEMLAEARRRPDAVEWVEADVATWAPEARPDLIFTNAALQWVPDHAELFPRMVRFLKPGGVFACQTPISYTAEWHVLLRETAAEGPWARKLEKVRGVRPVADPADYYGWLRPLCESVDVWSTTYLHVLEGEDPVVDWMLGTGLRPFLQALSSDDERQAFLDAYRARVSGAFPRRPEGTTLLPFPRLFLLCRRG
ncbi:MAG TPA: methyltransferase domain-containing protein [Caulobacteraceae bacterium]|nr:methyltransferase domain-containing protein [Caulobacteraceae bacterium]